MRSTKALAFCVAAVTNVTAVHGSVPIIVEHGARRRVLMKMCMDADDQLKNGDIAGAKRNVDAVLQADPKLWPALYVRAKIFARQGKYELAIQDCNEALRQYPASSRPRCCVPRLTHALGNTRKR